MALLKPLVLDQGRKKELTSSDQLDAQITYDNSVSGLVASNVKDAIDEVALSNSTQTALPALRVTQIGHGINTGNSIYFSGTAWEKAQSDDPVTMGYAVAKVVSDDVFDVYTNGLVEGLPSLLPGAWYFTSGDTPGLLQPNEPADGYSNPLGVALTPTSLLVIPMRAAELSADIVDVLNSSSTTILASSTTTLASE